MPQIIAPTFGLGTSGDHVPTNGTQSQTKGVASGTAGSRSLTSAVTLAPGDLVFIVQSQGTGVGLNEVNRVLSFAAGVATMNLPLTNTYTNPGAQVIKIPEYSSVTLNTGVDVFAPAWDGSTGGWIVYSVTGSFTGAGGRLRVDGLGYRGGTSCRGLGQLNNYGLQGEGESGTGGQTCSANGMGGGSSRERNTNEGANAGAGGGNFAAGGNGGRDGGSPNSACTAVGGGQSPHNDGTLSTYVYFGGGGGGGGCGDTAVSGGFGAGAAGGGGILIICRNFSQVTILAYGNNGNDGSGDQAGGGGGAGGSVLIICETCDLGTNLINIQGGNGGSGNANGGAGAVGRLHVSAGSLVGSIATGTIDQTLGGLSYLGRIGTSN